MRESPIPPHQIEPSLPVAVERTILKCIEKEPAKRFHSIFELEKALKAAAMNAVAAPSVAAPAAAAISAPVAVHAVKFASAPKRKSAAPIAWVLLGGILTLAGLGAARWVMQAEAAEQLPAPAPAATPRPPEFALEIPAVLKSVAPKPAAARPAAPALEALANLTPPAAKPGEKPTAPEKNQEADRPGEGTANSTASPNGSQFLFAGRFAREDKANERVKQLQRLDLPANVVVRHPEGRPAPIYLVVTGPFGPKRLNSVKEELESKGIQNVQPIKVPELGQHQ